MPRHVGAGIRAWGVSNTLSSRSGGAFPRSVQVNPKNRKDQKMTPGFLVDQVDEKTVRVTHSLGDRHGITSAAERVEVIEKNLAAYADALSGRFKVARGGVGEKQYILLTEYPDPAVARTLIDAAERLEKLGDHRTAALLISWAEKSSNGQAW